MRYVTRIGTARRRSIAPKRSLQRLPYRESEDDGCVLLHVGDLFPPCSDCSMGSLEQSDSGHDGHRICNGCGSHWRLHRLAYFMRRESGHRAEIDLGCFQGGLREPCGEDGVDGDDSPTHATLLALIQPHHRAQAIERAGGGIARLDACWARRERFYPSTPRRMP